jgi:hypothetical protein
LPLYPEELHDRIPVYEELNLAEAERFSQEVVTIPHPVLLAERVDLERIVDAVAKIKTNVDELLTAGRPA